MKRSLLGWVLLAGAAGLGFWWYRRQQSAGTGAPLTAGAANDLSNLQQVGSNISSDITPEIVQLTLDYAAKVNRGCWKLVSTLPGTATKQWRNNLTGAEQLIEDGRRPFPECGFET